MISTNNLIDEIVTNLETLTDWARADIEHSRENNAREQAREDARRENNYIKAIKILRDSYK